MTTRTNTYTCTHTYTHKHIHIHMRARVQTFFRSISQTCREQQRITTRQCYMTVHTLSHTHTPIHKNTHIYTHTQTHLRACARAHPLSPPLPHTQEAAEEYNNVHKYSDIHAHSLVPPLSVFLSLTHASARVRTLFLTHSLSHIDTHSHSCALYLSHAGSRRGVQQGSVT